MQHRALEPDGPIKPVHEFSCADDLGYGAKPLARRGLDHLRLDGLSQKDDPPRRIGFRPTGCRVTEGKDEQDYTCPHRGEAVLENMIGWQQRARFSVEKH
jgi:hypothetical protein